MLDHDQLNNFYEKLGQTIRHHRLLKNKNQEDLATHVGMSRVSIVNIEKGIQKVQIHTLVDIACFLEFNLDELKLLIPTFNDLVHKNFDKKINKELSQVNNQNDAKAIFEDFIKLTFKNK